IEEFAARAGMPVPLDPQLLALGLMGLCDGVQFLATADPQHVTPPVVEAVLGTFLARVVFGRDA
ncbi:TetR/AcrR family transcriptional regulator, partial [Paraburkholderia sp. BR14261]